MSDNTTAHQANAYETEVVRTIPFHEEIQRTAIDVVLAACTPKRWLDTGCGPGKLVELAAGRAAGVGFWLADPSEAMLALARARHASFPPERFVPKATADLPDMERFDTITAVLCHHYGDGAARARAVARCRELLVPGGVLVLFENVRAETDEGHAIQRRRWAAWQRRAGRDEATIEEHLAREGTAFFPIRVSDHLALLAASGFRTVEIVWRAYGQAGFFCVAPEAAGA